MTGLTDIAHAPLHSLEFAVVDLETSGLNANAEIVEIALIHAANHRRGDVFESLVRPERRIGNREIHGISNRDVRKAPRLDEIAGAIADHVRGRVLVAHNLPFDMRFLRTALLGAGFSGPLPTLCTMQLFRAIFGTTADLAAACEILRVRPKEPAHRAASDADTTVSLLFALLDECRNRGLETLAAVDAATGRDLCAKLAHRLDPSPRDTYRSHVVAALAGGSDHMVDGISEAIRMRVHLECLQDEIADLLNTDGFDDERRLRLQRKMRIFERLGWGPGEK